jgi:hypothetical protein
MFTSQNTSATFFGAMDREVGTITKETSQGTNGADEYTDYGLKGDYASNVQAALVAAWNGLTRGSTPQRVEDLFQQIKNTPYKKDSMSKKAFQNAMVIAIVMGFQVRNPRGGKGEKDVSRIWFKLLYKVFPQTILELVPEFPNYGYWKDLPLLIADLPKNHPLSLRCYEVMIEQLIQDQKAYAIWEQKSFNKDSNKQEKHNISLFAKYAPKEGRSADRDHGMANEMAKRLNPDLYATNMFGAKKAYRKVISKLNEAIKTTEVLMSTNRWEEINFTLVPGRCLADNRRGFMNLIGGSKCKKQDERSSCENRRKCRNNLLEHMDLALQGKTKLNSGGLFLHDLVNKIGFQTYGKCNLGLDEQKMIQIQWSSILKKLETDCVEAGVDWNQGGVICSDVSGSMSGPLDGLPMKVSVAMGIAISELQKGPFANRVLTFSEDPSWVQFRPEWSLVQKVQHLVKSPWGGSTDFLKCHELILDLVIKYKMTQEQIPAWFLTISDMQFNSANRLMAAPSGLSQWSSPSNINTYKYPNINKHCQKTKQFQTHHDIIREAYKSVGLELHGKGLEPPHAIYWNVNVSGTGHPVKCDEHGTQMISGFNQDLIPVVLQNAVATYQMKEKPPITPWVTLMTALDVPIYDKIHEIIANKGESIFNGYQPPVREVEDTQEDTLEEGFEVVNKDELPKSLGNELN